MKATATIGTILIVFGLAAFIAYQFNILNVNLPPLPPTPPPPDQSVPISVVFVQFHQLEGPTPVPGEILKVEDTGATVTSVNSIDPSKCPTVRIGPSYQYTFTATSYGPFPPSGIASQISVKISTPADLTNYEHRVTCVVGGPWTNGNIYYKVTRIELIKSS